MKILSLFAILAFSTFSYSFENGDQISCFDDFSNNNYIITITDIDGSEAYVKVKTAKGSGSEEYLYAANQVIFEENVKEIIIEMYDINFNDVMETITIDATTTSDDLFDATYSDGGDSRGMACHQLL